MDCAANASLASIRSISATVRPVFAMTFLVAAMGPRPMTSGSTPARAPATQVARGFTPSSLAFSSLITTRAAAPSLIRGRVAGGHDAVLGESRLQGAQLLNRGQTGAFIGIEHGVALLALDDNRNDLILERAVLNGLVSLDLAVVGELIQLLTGDGAVAVLLLVASRWCRHSQRSCPCAC